MDEAVVCPGCGQSLQAEKEDDFGKETEKDKIQRKNKQKKTAIIIITVLLCGALLAFLISIPVRNKMEADKKAEIASQLFGKEFVYENNGSFTEYRQSYSFERNGKGLLRFNIDDFGDYTTDTTKYKFEIILSGQEPYIDIDYMDGDDLMDRLTIKFDKYGDVIALYDPEWDRTFKKE